MSALRPVREDDAPLWLEAVEWHALRCGESGLTPAQCTAWQSWWQDAENRRIYEACARLHVDAQQFHPDPDLARACLRRSRSRRRGRDAQTAHGVLIGSALAVALTVVGGFLVMRRISPHAPPLRTAAPPVARLAYQTGAAQTRRVRLPDGSRVILGAETTLTVSLTPRHRAVTLKHGEAWFQVVHRRLWPFVVTAGNGTITDLGTAFVVDRESGRVEVTVTQGRVEVALAHALRMAPVRLQPIRLHRGERFSYGHDADHVVRQVDPRLALAWTSGVLEFLDEPLRAVVEDVNRYTRRPLEVSRAAGQLRVTTLVESRRIPAWLDGLSRVLPITVTRTDAAVCIRLRVSPSTLPSNTCRTR